MIRICLQNDKKGNIIFRALVDEDHRNNIIIKRSLFESRVIKTNKNFPYVIPMKFLLPIIRNFNKDKIEFCNSSLYEFLEFSDDYDEKFYYTYKASASYMKKWREEGCPKIYKVYINKEDLKVTKNIVFERII